MLFSVCKIFDGSYRITKKTFDDTFVNVLAYSKPFSGSLCAPYINRVVNTSYL